MCLSKVYVQSGPTEKMLLNNIQKISVDGDTLVFTDLLEQETRLKGRLLFADLVNGRIIVDTENN
jgi:predicted RNA-binding protein